MIKKFKFFESIYEIKPIEKYTMSDILDLSKSSLGMKEIYKYAEINDYRFTDYTIGGVIYHLKNVYNLNSHDNNLYNPTDSTKVITLNLEQQYSSSQSPELIKNGEIYTFRVHFRSKKNLCIHVNKSFMYKFLSIPDPGLKKTTQQNRIEIVDPKGVLIWDNGRWVEYNKDKDFIQKPFVGGKNPTKPIETPKKKISTKEMKDILGKIKDRKKL